MKYENYFLDLQKLSELDESDKMRVHEYYREMAHSFTDGRESVGTSFFNTLYNAGYLRDNRDKKLDKILKDED